MRTSTIKPIKNTMRKSPIKQGFMGVPNPAKKAIDAVTSLSKKAAAKKAATTKSTPATKPAAPEGKPNASTKPTTTKGPLARAKAKAEAPVKQLKKNKC